MSSEGSPSFSFTTPEQRHDRLRSDANAATSEDRNFRNGPSPIEAPRFQGEEQDESKEQDEAWNFAHSHFKRRNRLENRLEELQKDVASLTFKLRTNSNHSRSLDASSILFTPQKKQEEVQSFKTPRAAEKRRKEQVSGTGRVNAQSSTVKTLRELHNVTTERDQLKFELERTKRALVVAEKKCQDAGKSKKAYEKLKAHCDSLQDSLDLSEKIRVRQKKLLQQLQLQQQRNGGRQEKEAVKTRTTTRSAAVDGHGQPPVRKRPVSARTRSADRHGASGLRRLAPTTPNQPHDDSSTRGYTHTGYDILDSLVASSHNPDEEEEEDAGLATHEQAPSEPTAAASRSKIPRSVLKPTTPGKQYRPSFDSLLQVDTPQFSTRRPSRITTNTSRRPSETQVQQREAMRQAARWARTRGTAVDISTSTTQMSRRTPTAARPKNSFLAPTQASLRRLHDLPRRGDHNRPPFVV